MERTATGKLICLEIIGKCGLNCIHCSTRSNPENSTILDLNIIGKILSEGIEIGFNELAISGGDPFVHPNLIQIIRYAKELGYYVMTYTNGNMIGNDSNLYPLTNKIYTKLDKAGLDKIIFSLHSTNENIHDRITGSEGSFKNLIKSIENSKKGFSFQRELNFVIMRINLQDKISLIRFMKKYNINNIHLLRFVPHGRGLDNEQILLVEPDELNSFSEHFYDLNKDIIIEYSSSLPIVNIENNIKCRAGREEKLCITPKGYVFPCVAMKNIIEGNSSNNIKKYPLKTILENSKIFIVVNAFKESYNLIDWNCIECPAQQIIKNEI